MNIENRKASIVFRSETDTPIGELVKRLARGRGFEWKPLSGYPLPTNSSLVIVTSLKGERNYNALYEKCGVWDKATSTAFACYHLELVGDTANGEKRDQSIDEGESLLNWLLTECHDYGRTEISIVGPEKTTWLLEYEFKQSFNRTLKELIRYDGEVRPEAASIQEQTVWDYLRNLRASAESEVDENGIDTDDLDYLVGLFENGFDPLSIEDDYDMRAWYDAVEYGLTVLTDFLLAREIEAARWSYEDSPMMLACRRGDCGLVRKMLEQGWNPNHTTDVDHETPLTCAAESGSEELFFLLLEHGAELDYVGYDHELTTDPAGERFEITPEVLLDHAKKGKNERICRWLEGVVAAMAEAAKTDGPVVAGTGGH